MMIQTCTLMLKRLARTHDAQIYPSHEMAPFQTWEKAPTYYEG